MQLLRTILLLLIMATPLPAQDTVVLLHGLARSPKSMDRMDEALQSAGYHTLNLDYDSRHHSVETLAENVRTRILAQTKGARSIHFVTHSLGGILVRQIQASDPLPNLGRAVMLSPPNQGSEVVDRIGHWGLFKTINGPAGQQLGTAEDSFVNRLPSIDFECGIITGDRSINWINSGMIPGKDDGKVSIENAKETGATAFKVVHASHPMIMKKKSVIDEVIRFLKTGQFR